MLKFRFHPHIFPLLQHGSSTQFTVFQDKPVLTRAHCGPQFLKEYPPALAWGSSMGCSVDICSSVVSSLGCQVLCWGPFQALHGNLHSGAWSTSSPSFFTDPSVCRAVSHTFFLVLLPWSLVREVPRGAAFCGQGAEPCPVMGGVESSGTDHVQSRESQPPNTEPPAASKAWASTACSVNQDWFCPIAVVRDLSSFLLFPWFLVHILDSYPIERQVSALLIMNISSCATGGDSGPWLNPTVMVVLHMNL